jgi:hypothetical protein
VQVVVTGMGQAAAAAAAADWVPLVSAVVVCGVAGGTGGVARAGDVVVASAVQGGSGGLLPGVCALDLAGAVPGVVASVATPVDGVEERAVLLARGALAVETEAAGWAAACAAAGVPLVVVRGVLDTPEAPLGPAAGLLHDGERRPRLRTLAAALVRPARWPALVRVGRAAAVAERRAAETAVVAVRVLQATR